MGQVSEKANQHQLLNIIFTFTFFNQFQSILSAFSGIEAQWQLNDADEYQASNLIELLYSESDIRTSGKIKKFEGLPIED